MSAATNHEGVRTSEDEIVCLYIGTDLWQSIRWRSYFSGLSGPKLVVHSLVDNLVGTPTNLAMLTTANEMLREQFIYGQLEASICVVDFSFTDLDVPALESLRHLVGKFKEHMGCCSQSWSAQAGSPIIVLIPEELRESRDLVTSLGANLVEIRSKDLVSIITRCAELIPRFPKATHAPGA